VIQVGPVYCGRTWSQSQEACLKASEDSVEGNL